MSPSGGKAMASEAMSPTASAIAQATLARGCVRNGNNNYCLTASPLCSGFTLIDYERVVLLFLFLEFWGSPKKFFFGFFVFMLALTQQRPDWRLIFRCEKAMQRGC